MKRNEIKNKANWKITKTNYMKNKTMFLLYNNDYTTKITIHLREDGTASFELSSHDSESKKHPKVSRSTSRKLKSSFGGTFKVKRTKMTFDKTDIRLDKFVR
jgi:hypothetical protein